MSEKTTQASQLESALWNAADVLRGKMDASEYKNYLLGLIFYRFLSEKTLTTFRTCLESFQEYSQEG